MRNCGKQLSKGSRQKNMHKPVQEMRMNMAKVVYWSQTGNTQTMAEAVAKGITAAGGSAECVAVSDITPQDLAGEDVFALGCPAMGAEVLEESEMEPSSARKYSFCSSGFSDKNIVWVPNRPARNCGPLFFASAPLGTDSNPTHLEFHQIV